MKYVYRFQEGSAARRDLLGGKGANLSEMARLGLPVPPGFTVTTEACREYYRLEKRMPEGLWDDVRTHLKSVEEQVGHAFGSPDDPLLVSVRSGARFSMPGMMDTILNLGLNDRTAAGLASFTGDKRFALDSHRRFLQMFAKVVLRVPGEPFEEALDDVRSGAGASTDAEFTAEDLSEVLRRFRSIISHHSSVPVPDDPWEQLRMAIEAVFDSWGNKRATVYRDHHGIPHDLGTAVNIMSMVFGNSGWDSASGVCFTRDPADGTRRLYGEYLPNAQGEDVVSGARTPSAIAKLEMEFPDVYRELSETAARLESHYRDAQDIEFTIEKGRLFMLQTRTGKRTAHAAVKIAHDMAEEGLISREEAVDRVRPGDLAQLLMPRFDEEAKERALSSGRLLGRGLNASPGAASGQAIFDADTAVAAAAQGEPVILVRLETNADDIHGIMNADAVLTGRGGGTSHAAVVTRGLGKPAVVGCDDITVDHQNRRFTANGSTVCEGDRVSVDGFTGEVFLGSIDVDSPDASPAERIHKMPELAKILGWADDIRRLRVRANADTPQDAQDARDLGAEGIGLCRTEHMFFPPERLSLMQEMLLAARATIDHQDEVERAKEAFIEAGEAEDAAGRLREAEERLAQSEEAVVYHRALDQLLQFQRNDFSTILRAMQGKPVVIRLLDAPLHEFLPPHETLAKEIAQLEAKGSRSAELEQKESLLRASKELRETNPMLGHRGCRLGLTHPDVYEMQVRAIVDAAADLIKQGVDARPEIMIPLVAAASEFRTLLGRLRRVVEETNSRLGLSLDIPFGTMIELPRAALAAGELARDASFFSFGSNDLTQMVFGFSRDDAEEKFLRFYIQRDLLAANPFETIDEEGVGRLMNIAVEAGRQSNNALEIGLCGEHGGDPSSVAFCHRIGLDYVSCSAPRIPAARLAAAQAVIGGRDRDV